MKYLKFLALRGFAFRRGGRMYISGMSKLSTEQTILQLTNFLSLCD
jgi:hypothetical protein